MFRPPPSSTLFPYTTLFRSLSCRVAVVLTALARGLDPSEAPRVAGLATSDHHEPFSRARARDGRLRSEEHTSELQSPDHLVCRLLLEKKKKKNKKTTQTEIK